MTDNNLVTVAEIGQFAPEIDTSRYDAPTVSGFITSASKIVADFLEYTPLAETIVNELKKGMITNEGDLLIFPAKIPVASVTAISLVKGSETVDLTLQSGGVDRFNIDYTGRNVRLPYGEFISSGSVILTDLYSLRNTHFYTKMTYRGGWEPSALPGSIKHATILIVKDLMSGQYNAMGASRISQGSLSFDFRTSKGASTLNQQADRMLNPYRRIG